MKDKDIVALGQATREVVPLCSICHVKTHKQTGGEYQCLICQRTYLPEREIMEYPDTISSPHDADMPEVEGTGGSFGLLTDNEDTAASDLYRNKEKRLGVRPTENVTYYEEYI